MKIAINGTHVRQALSLLTALLLVGSVSYLGQHFYNSSHAATGASMYVNPSSGSVTSGNTLSVTVRENSGTDPVNTVQASLNYDASQLQYTGMSNGSFPYDAADQTDQAGVVRVARAIQSGTLTGDQPIVTINFKVLASSGTVNLSLDQSSSSVMRSTDNTDILATVSGGSYTVSAPAAPSPYITLQPSSGNYSVGSLINVDIHIVSSSTKVTVVEPVIQYPSNDLSIVKVTNSASFPTAMQDSNSNGTLDITRGVPGGSSGVSGDVVVATVQFKVIAVASSIPLRLGGNSAAYDGSGSGANILSVAASQGAVYSAAAVSGAAGGSSAPSTTAPTATAVSSAGQSASVYTRSGGITVSTTSGSGSVSQGGSSTQVQGSVNLAPAMNDGPGGNGATAIVKVEYYVGKKLIATRTTSPFTYALNTKTLKNDTYQLTIKTFYQNGTVDSATDDIAVRNPVTISYVLAHYTAVAGGTLLAAVLVLFFLWRFVWPHFHGGSGPADGGNYGVYTSYVGPTAGGSSAPVAPDPVIIQPTGGDLASPLSTEQASAAESVGAIPLTDPLPQDGQSSVAPQPGSTEQGHSQPPSMPTPPSV